jgi:uncharacterized DUF497 family protein
MVYWQKFDPRHWRFEFDEDELHGHGVTPEEAVEVFWNGFEVRKNKRSGTGYQVIGPTNSGRMLKLIVYERTKGVLRVITGWDV